nr:putative transposase (putative), gypsy type [Tanacetum cinerariifolium]
MKCIGDGGRSRNRLREGGSRYGTPVNKRRRKSGNNEAEANAPPKVLRRDYDAFRPAQSTHGGKSLASIGLDAGSLLSTPATQDPFTATKSVSDPEPLSYANPLPHPEKDIAQQVIQSSKGTAIEILIEDAAIAEVNIQFFVMSPKSRRSSSVSSMVRSPGGIYQSGWGVTNDCRLDAPDTCQDKVDHNAPPGYFSELRHLPNADFLDQYNITLAGQVAMGSQLRLRFEQEVRLLKKARSKIARRDQRIQVRDEEIKKFDQEMHGLQNQTKNLKTLLEAEVDMEKYAEAKSAELAKELDSLRAQLSDLQVSNEQLSDQVLNLQAHVMGEEKIKAAFEEFKKYKDDKVEQLFTEMDARLDKLSVDFDEELYPHMLTAIAGCRWVIGHGLRLVKCAESSEIRQAFADVVSAGLAKGMSEGMKYAIEHGKAGRDLADVEAYDPESNNKLVKAIQDLKDLKYPMIDQLEKLKDAPMDLIMASLYLESDTGEDAL